MIKNAFEDTEVTEKLLKIGCYMLENFYENRNSALEHNVDVSITVIYSDQ